MLLIAQGRAVCIGKLRAVCQGEFRKSGNKLRKLASMLVNKACDGDMPAAKEVLTRIEGMPTQVIEAEGERMVIKILKFTGGAEDDTEVAAPETGEDEATKSTSDGTVH